MFSIIMPLDPNRLEQFTVTKRTYDAMPQPKELILPTRDYGAIRQYLDKNDLAKDVKIAPYSVDVGFNVSKALNIGTRLASYPSIIITSPEIKPLSPVLDEFEKIIGTNVICKVYDENENGKIVKTLVRKNKRDESPRMYFLAMFNKADIEKINGWDEDFLKGYAYEDDDFGARWNRAGIPFIVRDDLEAVHQYHPRGETIPGGLEINRRKLQENNANGVIRPKNGLVKLDSDEKLVRKRILINDALDQLGEVTIWHKLRDWFDLEFVGGDYASLASIADQRAFGASLIIRSVSYFPPLSASEQVPTIGFIQEILGGRKRAMQDDVIKGCPRVVANSEFTRAQYAEHSNIVVIPLSIDFNLFQPGNRLALQHELGIPDGAVCWIGASQGPEAHVKGFDNFMQIVRQTPDITYVAVFKDADIEDKPANLLTLVRISQSELARVISAGRIGLCTSRIESQHLAGIEMGACGLPVVAPPVGIYWQRTDLPGALVNDADIVGAIRRVLAETYDAQQIRDYWYKEFNDETIRQKWAELIAAVEPGALGP